MAEGNSSDGFSKTRAVLGDLTNGLSKRGFFEREKRGIKSFDFSDKDVVKRIRVSPHSCTGINSLKGNAASSISNINDENGNANVVQFGSCAVSKSSIDVGTDCTDGNCLKRKSVKICNSNVHGGNKDIRVLDLGGEAAVSQNVNELDDDKDMVDSCDKIGCFDGGSLPNTDKMAGPDDKGPNLTDLVGGRASPLADGGGQLGLSKEKEKLGNAEIVCRYKSAGINHIVRRNISDLMINGGGEVALGSSEISKPKDDLSLIGRVNAFESVNIEADDELHDSFPATTSRLVSGSGGNFPHTAKDFSVDGSKASLEGTQSDTSDYQNDVDDHNADNLVSSQCGSIDCPIIPESQESRVFGGEKSMELKEGDVCALSRVTDSIKACSCSFCTKAAYIWLDLNYQDIKARVSATRKIQKEAKILAERSIRSTVAQKHGAESFTRVSKLESDLMYQWTSLFQHMADIWEEEGNQLEARLLPLTDLRQKCKTDLALINAPPPEEL